MTETTVHQPQFVDTHCHLDIIVKGFDSLPNQHLTTQQMAAITPIVERAVACGVNTLVTVGTTLEDSHDCIAIAQHFEQVHAAIGLHPTNLTASWQDDLARIEQLFNQPHTRIVALGETGIDLYHPGAFRQYQEEAFHAHLQLALHYNLPILIHSRDAALQTMAILQEYAQRGLRGIMHCFAYDEAIAIQAIKMGLHLGVSCTITRPNNRLRSFINRIDLARIVLETDAPFLPPQQLRGTRNEPANIPYAAQTLANILQKPLETIAQLTTENAQTLFRI